MGVTKKGVEATLTSKLSPSYHEVIDASGGCGASFAVETVSEQFEGKRLLERHRMVNTALVEETKEIHALSIKKALTATKGKHSNMQAIPKLLHSFSPNIPNLRTQCLVCKDI